jgi:hypothetical protein
MTLADIRREMPPEYPAKVIITGTSGGIFYHKLSRDRVVTMRHHAVADPNPGMRSKRAVKHTVKHPGGEIWWTAKRAGDHDWVHGDTNPVPVRRQH